MNIPEELLPVVEWWEKDGKKTLAIVAVAGLAYLCYWGWMAHRESVRNDAADALSAAVGSAIQVQMDAKGAAATAAIDELKSTVATFGARPEGAVMKLMLAADYFARKEGDDVQQALAIYDELVKSGTVPAVYKDVPVVGRAQCLEALGQFDAAREAFDAFVEATPDSYLALTAKLGAARALAQAGDKAGAVARLEALKEVKDVDQAAVAFTLDLVKRWIPAAERTPAPAPAPEAAPAAPASAPEAAPVAPAPASETSVEAK